MFQTSIKWEINPLTMKSARNKNYNGVTLLGNTQARIPTSPEKARLETFPNPNPKRDYSIRLDCPDFTSLCPVTGQPDFASLVIDYTPGRQCLETKALKLYLSSYRNVPLFNEAVINLILDDLVRACQPRYMRLEAQFASRGGISLTVTAEHPSGRSRRN
jgi:7-cyano-7-deazaguanine reductase